MCCFWGAVRKYEHKPQGFVVPRGRFVARHTSFVNHRLMQRQPQRLKAQRLPETCPAVAAVNHAIPHHPDQHPTRRKVGDTSRGDSVKVKGIVISAIFPQIVIGGEVRIKSAGGNSGNTAAQSPFTSSIPGNRFSRITAPLAFHSRRILPAIKGFPLRRLPPASFPSGFRGGESSCNV